MRKELFDHYQSAFDDAVGDDYTEEVAHKKVLQDLGWETTVMVGRVCKGMGWWGQGVARYMAYKRDIFPAWQKKINRLVLFLSLLIAIPCVSYFSYNSEWLGAVVLPLGLGVLYVLGITNQKNKMKTPSKQPLLTLPILTQRIRRTTLLNRVLPIFLCMELFVFYLVFDDFEAFLIIAFPLIIAIVQFYIFWVYPFKRFMRSWKNYTAKNRIF